MYFMNKTLSFAVVHFLVAFTVTWLLTGSLILGGLIALIEPAVNTVAYFFHEKAWARFGPPVATKVGRASIN
jgi:uncharacterized membrane protein